MSDNIKNYKEDIREFIVKGAGFKKYKNILRFWFTLSRPHCIILERRQ